MAGKTVTIRDVARDAGVSVSTVSRILSGADTPIAISHETRVRVEETVRHLNYRPHPGARSLRGKGTNLLGLIVREIDDLFFGQLVKVLHSEARQRGMDIVLGHAEADISQAARLGQLMQNMRFCDGIFLLGDLGEEVDDRRLLAEINSDVPVVVFCRGAGAVDAEFSSVTTDNYRGVELALEYLSSLGHRSIAYLGTSRSGDFSERLDAYCLYMQSHLPGGLLLHKTENSMEGGYLGMQAILDLPKPPTAVFAADDAIATGALSAAAARGWNVPRDISVVGFDDVKSSAFCIPALTTIRQQVLLMGQVGIEQLVSRLSGARPAAHVMIDPQLVIRESCALPRGSG
jgi:DNA-binding LacI/PurR family transcriptional regulator